MRLAAVCYKFCTQPDSITSDTWLLAASLSGKADFKTEPSLRTCLLRVLK